MGKGWRIQVIGGLYIAILALFGVASAQESYLVVEAHSGKIVSEYQADLRRPVASLAKIATAMVVLDWAKFSGSSMSQLAVVPTGAAYLGGSNPMGLAPGDRIELREAMYSMLLGSDNVAAFTLSEHVGRSIAARSGGNPQSAFVREMNNLAQALGMTKTRFVNSHGMDSAREKGNSTAKDIARLSVYACRNAGFRFYVKQKSRKIASMRGNQRRGFTVKNTNELLGSRGINGVKSGSTPLSGPCLAVSAEKSPIVVKSPDGRNLLTQRRLIIVILGSPDRWNRGKALLAQGWNAYESWRAQGRPVNPQVQDILNVSNP